MSLNDELKDNDLKNLEISDDDLEEVVGGAGGSCYIFCTNTQCECSKTPYLYIPKNNVCKLCGSPLKLKTIK